MLGRSEENCKAAKLLLEKHQFDACVVAYYYSILQRMMYALNEYEGRPFTYERQSALKKDFHDNILIEIKNRIANKKYEDSFEELFEALLEYRKKADYQAASITLDECTECRSLYDGLIWRLDRYFPVRK